MLKWYNILAKNKVSGKEVINFRTELLHEVGLKMIHFKQFRRGIDEHDSTGT